MSALNNLLACIRPLVNASGLEVAAGLPRNTLGKHYSPMPKIQFISNL